MSIGVRTVLRGYIIIDTLGGWGNSAQLLGIPPRDQVPVVSFVFQMLVWFSPDLIPFHLLTWQLVIGCTDYQI